MAAVGWGWVIHSLQRSGVLLVDEMAISNPTTPLDNLKGRSQTPVFPTNT